MADRDHVFIEKGGACWTMADVLKIFTGSNITSFAGSQSLGAYGPSGTPGYRVHLALNSSAPMENRVFKTIGGGRAWGSQSFWFKDANISDGKTIAEVYDGGTPQLALYRESDGTISVFQGPDRFSPALVSLGRSSASFSAGSHHHIEWQWIIDSVSGMVKVFLDGNTAPIINYSGGSTSFTGSNVWNGGSWGHRFWNNIHLTQANDLDYSDMVLRDDLSAYGTAQLGATSVLYRFKKTGNGHYDDFTRSSGSDTGALLRDLSGEDGVSSFVHGSAPGIMTSGPMDPITAAFVNAYWSQLTSFVATSGAGTSQVRQFWRSGGVDTFADTTQPVTSAFGAIRDIISQLNGSPLSKLVLSGEEAGFTLG